jgi:hypothetical protein
MSEQQVKAGPPMTKERAAEICRELGVCLGCKNSLTWPPLTGGLVVCKCGQVVAVPYKLPPNWYCTAPTGSPFVTLEKVVFTEGPHKGQPAEPLVVAIADEPHIREAP